LYNITLNISNILFNQTINLYDFISTGFNSTSYSLAYNDNYSFIGSKYSGKYLIWNLNMTTGENKIINYQLNGTSDYDLEYLFMCGLD